MFVIDDKLATRRFRPVTAAMLDGLASSRTGGWTLNAGLGGVPEVAVWAPSIFLSVTIEEGAESDDPGIHLHAGGHGIWIAWMLAHLGGRPVVWPRSVARAAMHYAD